MAAVSFGRDGEFLRHQRPVRLDQAARYATAQGERVQGLCRMPGSTPDRRISFFLLQSNLMALAVSTDGYAARAQDPRSQAVQPLDRPGDPVWLSIPARA